MGTDVAGGIGMNYQFPGRYFPLVFGLADYLRDVIADGFRKTGGMHGNDIRFVNSKNIIDSLQQIGLPPEDAGSLGKRAGAAEYRLLVMPCQRTAVISAASLRTVAVRQAVMNPESGIHRSYRLARLGRVDGQRLALYCFRLGMSK
jgi:hypothetical protein